MLTVRPKKRQDLSNGRDHNRHAGDKARPQASERLRESFVGLRGAELVRVVYSDEWGVGSLDQEPITVVAGVVLNMDSQWDAVESDLSEAIRQIPNRLLFERKELKGRLLLKSIRKKDRYADAAKKGLAEILSLVPKHGLHIFHGAIDRRGYDNSKRNFNISDMRTTGYQLEAFDECLTRLDDFVHNFLPREKVLWIADKTGYETHLKDGLAFYQRLQVTDFVHYENKVVEVARSDPQPSHVLDTIYFGHSHESRALQLADVCCTVIALHLLKCADTEPFYTLIRGNVVTDGRMILFSRDWGGQNVE